MSTNGLSSEPARKIFLPILLTIPLKLSTCMRGGLVFSSEALYLLSSSEALSSLLRGQLHDQTRDRARDQTCGVMSLYAIKDKTVTVVVTSYRSVSKNSVRFKALKLVHDGFHVVGQLGKTINGAQAINVAKQGENILKFNSFHKQLPVSFVIYADFEAITKKVQSCKQNEEMEKDKDRRSYTEAYQTNEDCGYGYKVICCYDDKYGKYTCIYRSENAVYKFMENMLEEVKYCRTVIKKHFNKPLVMTEVDEQNYGWVSHLW